MPDLLHYYARFRAGPQYVALGFAAYVQFMRGTRQAGDQWRGGLAGQKYLIQDERAGYFAGLRQQLAIEEVALAVLSNQELWGTDLAALPGFADRVTRCLTQMQQHGAAATLATVLTKHQRAAV